MSCIIKMLWDDDAQVWVATSEDVPGLALESGSFDALIERVRVAVPELMRLNGATTPEFRPDYQPVRSDLVYAYG